jgi:pectate lyase
VGGATLASDVTAQEDTVRHVSRAVKEQLLEGLEGYPAEPLAEAVRRMPARLYLVTRVDDPAKAEPGTVRAAVESARSSPKDQLSWIVFDPAVFDAEKESTIELSRTLDIGSNVVLDGRGAKVTIWSREGIHLVRLLDARNVILINLILHKTAPFAPEKHEKGHHFPVAPRRNVDPTRAALGVKRDGIAVRGASDNIWIDHCTFSLCGDEAIGAGAISSDALVKVTVSWCKFYDQYYAALFGHTNPEGGASRHIRLTFHHNYIQGTARRAPRVNRGRADVYNNYYEGWVDWAMAANSGARVLVEANVFEPRKGDSRAALISGTGKHPKGFVRIRCNALRGGTQLSEHRPEEVAAPPYCRSIDRANAALKERLVVGCGWQPARSPLTAVDTSAPGRLGSAQ